MVIIRLSTISFFLILLFRFSYTQTDIGFEDNIPDMDDPQNQEEPIISIDSCGSEVEYNALMRLYDATDGPNWKQSNGWGDHCNFCDLVWDRM